MELTESQVLTWLGHFLWPFLRITGLFITAPLFGSTYIPAAVKALTAASLALSLALWLPDLPPFPGDPISAIYQGITQIIYGGVLGLPEIYLIGRDGKVLQRWRGDIKPGELDQAVKAAVN